jgi:hypothetical protein
MSSEGLQFKMGKRERERKERVEGAFIPRHTEKSHYSSKIQNVWENPGNSGSPETPSKTWILRPSKVSTQENNPVNVLVQRCLS